MDIESLKNIIDPSDIRTDDENLKIYGKDWTKHFTPNPSAIVFPRNAEQVKKLVLWARKTKTALVPSGGRTGLSAAAYATNKEIIVSFEKMNKILELDAADQTLRCEAGVVTETIQNYALEKGYYFPVDFASRGSSQIGGNAATNAGGIKVIRYGLIRNWISALEVVTGRGEILKLNNSLVKNATGYDFRHLFIGSEGTLGFITEVTVNLTRPPKSPVVLVLGVPDLAAIMEVFKLYRSKFNLLAYEMFTDLAVDYVTKMGHAPRPFETKTPYYVLIELEQENESTIESAMELFESASEKGLVLDATLSQNDKQARELWSLREDITEATSHKFPYKNDISVRISKVPQFLKDMTQILDKDYPDFEVVWFGHIGDGNLHVNILKPESMTSEEFMRKCKLVDQQMMSMIEKHGGSVSAEHGVGLVKKPFLKHTRSETEIQLMREVKKVFDPDGIINPGKMFD
jgi:FAD/FMN-containing dehydrogenase